MKKLVCSQCSYVESLVSAGKLGGLLVGAALGKKFGQSPLGFALSLGAGLALGHAIDSVAKRCPACGVVLQVVEAVY